MGSIAAVAVTGEIRLSSCMHPLSTVENTFEEPGNARPSKHGKLQQRGKENAVAGGLQ